MKHEHPVEGVRDSAVFCGTEVEGVVTRGLRTLIVRRQTSDEEWAAAVESANPQQVFVTEEFSDFAWLESTVLPWANNAGAVVTIGREAAAVEGFLGMPCARRCRLVVRFWGYAWHRFLRPDDEVSIGDPFDMLTMPARGAASVPSDYRQDKAASRA